MRTLLVLLLIVIGRAAATLPTDTNQSCHVVQMNTDTVTALNETIDEDSWACFVFEHDGSITRIYQLSTEDISRHYLEQLGWAYAALPISWGMLAQDNETLIYNHSESDVDLVHLINDILYWPNTGTPQNDAENPPRYAWGSKTVLVVRVLMTDTTPTVSADQIRDSVFGEGEVTLCSQFAACSKNQFLLSAASGEGIVGGVLDIDIGVSSTEVTRGGISAVVDGALKSRFGSVQSFNYVMICTPDVWGQWTAFAFVRGRYSVYRNRNILWLSFQMHEIGHNVNLYHAGTPGSAYGDMIGFMGASMHRMNGPVKCYNGAMNYKLGWFRDCQMYMRHEHFWAGMLLDLKLIGSADYTVGSCRENEVVLWGIWQGRMEFFVSYNMKTGTADGSTAQTQALGDQVTLHTINSAQWNGPSLRIGSLNVGESFTYTAMSDPFTVQFCEIEDGRAAIAISRDHSDPCSARPRQTTSTTAIQTTPNPDTAEDITVPPRQDSDEFDWYPYNAAPRTPRNALSLVLPLLLAIAAVFAAPTEK